MDVLTLVLALASVVMLALGGYLAVGVPRAIRQANDPVIVKALGVLLLGGGASALLSMGGALMAALVGAAGVAVWLGLAFMVGAGVVALSVGGFTAYAVGRTVAGKRRTPVR